MAIPNMSDEQMRSALRALEQASYNHEQWAETLYGTLICHLPPDERDLSEQSHHQCRFGQWYYGPSAVGFREHAGFAEIGLEHESMHRYAASLLRASLNGTPISIQDYERFVTALKRLKLEMETVRHELDDALFNLDPLTGTPSRVGMLTKLREQQDLVRRKVQSCVVAMFDLDKFKTVNDRYGHAAGDAVLVAFARYVTAHLRPYDKLFRYGGEEFLACLPDTDLTTGAEILDRLRDEFGSVFHAANGDRFQVTVSCGLTLLDPDERVERSIDRADRALYAAKHNGRNSVVVWDPSMGDAPAEPGPG